MTELARAGIHPRIIQKRAGHSSLATTQRYIEVTPDQERRAVRAIRSRGRRPAVAAPRSNGAGRRAGKGRVGEARRP